MNRENVGCFKWWSVILFYLLRFLQNILHLRFVYSASIVLSVQVQYSYHGKILWLVTVKSDTALGPRLRLLDFFSFSGSFLSSLVLSYVIFFCPLLPLLFCLFSCIASFFFSALSASSCHIQLSAAVSICLQLLCMLRHPGFWRLLQTLPGSG
jgi:hypothetical protein